MVGVRSALRFAGVAIVVALALVVVAQPASAHTDLVSVDPARGTRLDVGPDVVSLRFTDPVDGWGTAVAVTDPDGVDATLGMPVTEAHVVTQMVRRSSTPGRWTVTFRVVGPDGHPVQGTTTFDVAPGTSTATPDAVAPVADPGEEPISDPDPDPGSLPVTAGTIQDDGASSALPGALLALVFVVMAVVLIRTGGRGAT